MFEKYKLEKKYDRGLFQGILGTEEEYSKSKSEYTATALKTETKTCMNNPDLSAAVSGGI